ncbi:alpha/beta fold hydrolase [Nonlabens xiamenensis]|uniref:alpha/beta fold hydrolase n=1 Tax=Nonlabens xiamenensis TaxID=2341043 RepID=UPI000F60DE81|nr:alpha/beta fold hydrolase [Nonlabens xiamenensis]
MSKKLEHITLTDFQLKSGVRQDLNLSYQVSGRSLHSAPIILVTHALTGNSSVGEWWPELVGAGKLIDTDQYTVLCFDIPGNGHDGIVDHLVFNYKDWCLADVASAFAKAIQQLGIDYIELGIGGSIGGALLWELLVQQPGLLGTIVPIAADWKASDWVVACCHIQEEILRTSNSPVAVARKHAMTFYRSPIGLKEKFARRRDSSAFKVTGWLDHHGRELKSRFSLPAYRLMNHLLSSADAAGEYAQDLKQAIATSETAIEMIAIDTDGLFVAAEDRDTYELLKSTGRVEYHEIASVHGHDAFLIEHDQVAEILAAIFERRGLTGCPAQQTTDRKCISV